MSGQSVAMFLACVAIALAAQTAEDISWIKPQVRGPASVNVKKEIERDSSPMKHTNKLSGPLSASVELVGARPERAGDVFVLKGVIESEESVQNVEFKWSLPKSGVEVVSGEVNSVVAVVSTGKRYETQLTLRTLTGENARVHFRVKGAARGMKFGETVQYNSMLQEVLDASRKELRKSTEEHSTRKEADLKVFH